METIDDKDLKIIEGFITTLNPLVINVMPRKNKTKLILLNMVTNYFENNHVYTEKEVNVILKEIMDDYVYLRRLLIENQLLKRSDDGGEYWKNVWILHKLI